ncbi:hypothetical protein ACA910_011298 [Epithemia clementina (nom. ined.)]
MNNSTNTVNQNSHSINNISSINTPFATTNNVASFDVSFFGAGEPEDNSLTGTDLQASSLGISFDGESILMPSTGGNRDLVLPMATAIATSGGNDLSTIHGDCMNNTTLNADDQHNYTTLDDDDEERPGQPPDRVYAAIVNEEGRIAIKEVSFPGNTTNSTSTHFSSSKDPKMQQPLSLVSAHQIDDDDDEENNNGGDGLQGAHAVVVQPTLLFSSSSSSSSSCCCPAWIQEAPYYLKVYILGAMILFLGAMALTIYTTYQLGQNHNSAAAAASTTRTTTTKGQGASDDSGPSPSPSPTMAPIVGAVYNSESPTFAPSSPLVARDPTRPDFVPLNSYLYDTTAISFYVTGGLLQVGHANASDAESLSSLLAQLPVNQTTGVSLDDGNHSSYNSTFPGVYEASPFLVHLGSWNTDSEEEEDGGRSCPRFIYRSTGRLFASSSVPVFFVLGDEEFTDCAQSNAARRYWRNNLGDYNNKIMDQNADDTAAVSSFTFKESDWQWWPKPNMPEQFSFVLGSVLFVGLHIAKVRLEADDASSSTTFDLQSNYASENLDWIEENYNFAKNGIRIMVLLTNNPLYNNDDSNPMFYSELREQILTDYEAVRVILVQHTRSSSSDDDGGGQYKLESEYQGVPNWDVITVKDSVWPPMKVDLLVQQLTESISSAVVTVATDQDQWFNKSTTIGD